MPNNLQTHRHEEVVSKWTLSQLAVLTFNQLKDWISFTQSLKPTKRVRREVIRRWLLRNTINLKQLLNNLQTSSREDLMPKLIESLEIKVETTLNIIQRQGDSEGMTKMMKSKNTHKRKNQKKHARLILRKEVRPKTDMRVTS